MTFLSLSHLLQVLRQRRGLVPQFIKPVSRFIVMDDLLWCEETVEWVVRKKVRTEDILDDDDQAQMIIVKNASIPSFLHDSEFYHALSDESNVDDVIIPKKYYSAVDKVKNFPDLLHMLEVMTFWSVDTIPDGVIDFCHYCHHWDRKRLRQILNNTIDEVGFLSELKQIFCSDDPLTTAIRIGRTEVVQYLAKDRTNCYDPGVIALAAFQGNISYIQILRLNGYKWSSEACANAALKGHLNCLQYLHESGCDWDCEVYACAGYTNQWDCFIYAFENGLQWQFHIPSALIDSKDSNFLKFAIKNGCPLTALAVQAAAKDGSVDCLSLLLNARCPLPEQACSFACQGNRVENLQLLHRHGVPWDEKTAAAAAMRGSLSCLQYLHEQGCPWNAKTTEEAARYGRYNSLKYAMENGCPYDDSIIVTAAWSESPIDCLQYLIEEQGLYMGDNGKLLVAAIRTCKPVVVQYLIDQGYNIHYRTDTVANMLLYSDWYYEMKPSLDESLLECIKIALQHNWNLHRQAPALLRKVVRFSSEVPLLYAYLQAEGYVE